MNKKTIYLNYDEVYNFRKNTFYHQDDGWDRALWYDLEENRMFSTCETKNTNIVSVEDNEKIINLIYVKGDNNEHNSYTMCECCTGCCDNFMIKYNIQMTYHEFVEMMDKLYYGEIENKYNISEEDIDEYQCNKNKGWEWFDKEQFLDCMEDTTSRWWSIEDTDDIVFIEE